MKFGDHGTITGTGFIYWDQLVFVNSHLIVIKQKGNIDPGLSTPLSTFSYSSALTVGHQLSLLPVSIHLTGTKLPDYIMSTPPIIQPALESMALFCIIVMVSVR